MKAARFEQANIEFKRPEGWTEEQCNDIWGFAGSIPGFKGNYGDSETNPTPVTITCWQPTDAERVRIAAGEPIYLHIVGSRMPPVLVSVDSPWEAPEAKA